MLNVLIVESDPVIAMDLRDSVIARDRDARITMHARPLPQAEIDLGTGRYSHAFLRASQRDHHPAAVRLARSLRLGETRVVLHGAEVLPEQLRSMAGVMTLPFPFSAQDVLRCLEPETDPDDPLLIA